MTSTTSENIQRILGDLAPADFMTHVFGRRHHLAKASFAESPTTTAWSEDGLWSCAIDTSILGQLSASVVRGAASPPLPVTDIAEVQRARHAGFGLILAGIEQVLQPDDSLLSVLGAIAGQFALPARGITAFLSPAGVSLVPHNDVYEAFTVQLAGRKRWQLYDVVAPGIEIRDAAIELPEPIAEIVLEPGDVLYVPKGQIHRVISEPGETSVSAALIFQPASWRSVIDVVLDRAKQDPAFWQSVNTCDLSQDLRQRKSKLLKAILELDESDIDDVLERYR